MFDKPGAKEFMRIVCNGHPALRKISEPIPCITSDVLKLAEKLTDSLVNSDTPGVGLAAPQIGINRRMVVIDTRPDKKDAARRDMSALSPGEIALEPQMPVVLVNPEIEASSAETHTGQEGCLSLPEIWGEVTRPARVVLHATLLDGKDIRVECANLLAICLQHEIDHLDGILFIDRVSQADKDLAAAQLRKLEKEELRRRKR